MRKLLPALALWTAGAAAAPPADPTIADLEGARTLSLAASRGLPGGNDGMFSNAAALAARRRYSIEGQFLQERLDGGRKWEWFQLSVVDSETSAVTGGAAYTRLLSGNAVGNVYHAALAGPVGGGVYLGATGKYLDVRTAAGSRIAAATADAGLYWQVSTLVGVGVAGYNLVPVGEDAQAPRALGAGISVGDERRYHLLADWRRDFERAGRRTDAWMVGGEVLLGDFVPVRAGYLKDDTRGGAFWSVGAGLVSGSGIALDLAYRQSVEFSEDRAVALALKVFVPTGR